MFLGRTFRRTLSSYATYTGRNRARSVLLPGWRSLSASAESKNELPSEANVVIIGGGAAGTSLAYHLAKQGCESVLLLELSELTAGSTWHAAGLVTSFHPMANLKPLHKYSLDLFSQLEKETGQEIGLHCPGSIRFATTEERAEEMRYQVSRNRGKGNPARLMTAAEIAHHCPLLQTDTIKLGLYTFDGHLDPYSMTQAYAKGARRYGAKLLQNTRVMGLRQETAGDWLLSTSRGDVKAAVVVNAAGFHARDVGIMAGYKLPLVAVHHQYLVTSSIPEVQKLSREMPILRYMEASSYIRMERDGLLIGVYEAPEKMKLQENWMRTTVPTDFSKQLFEPDLERCESYHAMVMDIIPCLKSAQIQSIVNGPITYSPDGLPMVGPHTMPNMWLAVGFGFGIIHSGGIGKYLADYIMHGEPPFELSELDPARFKESWVTDDYALAKVRETYGMANHPSYPNDERFAGRPSSRVSTALLQQQARGASCMPHAGWEQPAWFAGEGNTPKFKPAFRRTNWFDAAIKESQVVMKAAGIIDLTPFGKFIVSGTQAGNLLSKATANSLPKEGRCVVTHALTSRGTILAELTISRTPEPDSYMVVTGSGSEVHDLRWLQQKARQWGYDKVIFTNVTEDLGCLSVAGPLARDVLRAASDEFPDVFPYFGFKTVNLAGVSVDALHLSYTGEDGWELYHPREHTDHLYSALLQAGQPHGLGDFGTHALNILRQEKGFRGWGTEMNVDTTMAAAGMMSFVDWNKGEFEGRAALLKQRQTIPESLLVQVSLHSPKLDPIGDESVWCNGGLVGNTTSGCHSPALGKSLAFCYLPPFLTVPGTQVEVEILNELLTAEVLARPPLDTHNIRLRKKKRQN